MGKEKNEADIIYVQDKDPAKVIMQFAEEIAKSLIANELAGKALINKLMDPKRKEDFMTGYVAALIDYFTARSMGHIEEPVFGNKKV